MWNKWKKSFVYYIEASGITNDVQNRKALLHLVGIETQEIFETFQDTGNTYYQAVTKLHEHFNVKKNISYERSVFRDAKQETNQSLDQFITRLHKLTTYCEYGNNVNDEITDQVIHTCRSTKLQTRLLQEQDLTLEKVQNIGRIIELSIKQSKNIEEPLHGTNADIDEVNKLVKQPFKSKRKYKSQDYKKACKHSHSKEKHTHDVEKRTLIT